MQLLVAKFNQIASAIDATNAQIAALQTKLSELQEHQQQLLSVEQACQSALAQVDTALMMLHHVDPSQVGTFQVAIEAKFSTEAIAQLPASPEPEPAAEPAPEPTAPTAPEPSATPENEPAIDVEVAESTDAPIEPTAPTSTTPPDIEGLLNKLSIQSIRKLAAAKGASGHGTRAAIAGRLKKLVTEAEVRAAG
ncbi:MAG TPA: hypothetical protein V6D04_11400 [Candidatus Obscuribacterales bacterium]